LPAVLGGGLKLLITPFKGNYVLTLAQMLGPEWLYANEPGFGSDGSTWRWDVFTVGNVSIEEFGPTLSSERDKNACVNHNEVL
jgi:hypothetical protein